MLLAAAAMAAFATTPVRAAATCVTSPAGPAETVCVGAFIVSGPQAQTAGFLTPAMAAPAGGPVTYVNADIVGHNVVSCHFDAATNEVCDTGPDTQPWCYLYEDVANGETGHCPLFWSPVRGPGALQIQGLENAPPGTYSFWCEPHKFAMHGTLVVLPTS
jgi:plastocyanin